MMPRAQNREAKGSTLLRRLSIHFAHLGILFIYGVSIYPANIGNPLKGSSNECCCPSVFFFINRTHLGPWQTG